MAKIARLSMILLTTCAAGALSACDGASSVASPGPGTIVVPPPAPAPTPTPTPTPSPLASFAETTQSTITVTKDEQLTVFNAGTNNTVNGTNPLNALAPTGGALTTTPFNAATLSPFFVSTGFIGALQNSSDTSFQGWTCSSNSANFSNTSPIPAAQNCASSLARSAAAPAASDCPTGTTDAGTNSNYRLCRLPSLINANLSLPAVAGVAYQINGRVDVGVDVGLSGAGGTPVTLTVAAGALFVANNADPANDFLVVNRGSKMNAVGTVAAPIIFTSTQNLNPATNGDASQGQWGGVILAGRAPISNCNAGAPNNADGTVATCENVVEGTGNALYGGTLPNDSSGTLQYIQIRYSGIEITLGNELQGLTLGGVGNGTVIDHINVHNSSDDGIEIFGGTANLKYLALVGSDDDGLDTDVGWRGFVQFLIAAQKTIGATSDSFSTEIDSNGNEDFLPRQFGRLANFTFIQTSSAPAAIRLRGGADYTFVNGIVKAVGPCLNIVAGTDANGGKSTIRAANPALQEEGPPKFNSIYFACNGA